VTYYSIMFLYAYIYNMYMSHVYISYIYIRIYDYIWSIPETQGSRKGHQQIWEGPIAWHMFVRKWYILYKFSGHHMKENDICTQVWHNLQRGYRSLGRSYLASVTCTISENQCPSLTCFWLPELLRWLIHTYTKCTCIRTSNKHYTLWLLNISMEH
jgi:hypothetical protein